MKRLVILLIAWSGVAFVMASANPARPLYEPTPAPRPVAPKVMTVDMRDTKWLGKYNISNRYFTFEADGTVSYSPSPTAKGIKNRGTWKVEGNSFFFDHHIGQKQPLMEFRGTFQDPFTIVGEQTMLKTGQKSNVTMKRADMVPK